MCFKGLCFSIVVVLVVVVVADDIVDDLLFPLLLGPTPPPFLLPSALENFVALSLVRSGALGTTFTEEKAEQFADFGLAYFMVVRVKLRLFVFLFTYSFV